MNPMKESEAEATVNDPMMEEEEEEVEAGTVFHISLEQSPSTSLHKITLHESMRCNFSAVAWCAKLNVIACATETCANGIPRSSVNPRFWIPIHIVIPERPTEIAAFNVVADSSLDSVQSIQWSPICCPRALLIANFQGRVTIWTQPSQGPANLVIDTNCWQLEHEWRQDTAVVTKWLSGDSPYRWFSSKSRAPTNSKSRFVEKFISQQPQTSARWPNFLCVCSVFRSGKVQLHWSQRPPTQNAAAPKWFCTSKGLFDCGTSRIIAADAIITDSGTLHVAGVQASNPATVIVWEVLPGRGNGLEFSPKTSITTSAPLSPPNWGRFSPLPAFLFSWQDQSIPLHCSTVSSFSAYVSSEAAPTTQCCGVAGVAFDPTRGGSVIAAVVVEGMYMSPHDPDEGPSITGWRVQRWESSFQPVVLHPLFESFDGNPPMQTIWESKVDICIPALDDKSKGIHFNPFDLPTYLGTLARVGYSA